MNYTITQALSSISVPNKSIVLSILLNENKELSSSVIRHIGLDHGLDENFFTPVKIRDTLVQYLHEVGMVEGHTYEQTKGHFWKLRKRSFGDLAQRALLFEKEVQLPVWFFLGRPMTFSKDSVYSKPHVLNLARHGELDGLDIEEVYEKAHISSKTFYDMIHNGLLLKGDDKIIAPTPLALKFMYDVYDFAKAVSKRPRSRTPHSDIVDANFSELYTNSITLYKKMRRTI